MSQAITKPPKLLPDEEYAYREYIDAGKPPLAPVVQRQLYELFLNGKSCNEIVRLNPNFSLGMVVRARIDGKWDERRDAYLAEMLDGVRGRVQSTQMEAVNFACDLLSAVHKMQGDKLKKYIQTGNADELDGIGANLNLKTYETVVRLLLELTGQDNKKKVTAEVTHTVAPGSQMMVASMTPSKAAKILEIIDDAEEVQDIRSD